MKLKDLVISAEPSVFSLKILVTECPEAVPLPLGANKKLDYRLYALALLQILVIPVRIHIYYILCTWLLEEYLLHIMWYESTAQSG